VLQALVDLSPADAVAILPHLRTGSSQIMMGMLARANRTDEALALFRETAATFAEPLDPAAALWLAMNALPTVAAESYERVIRAASAPDYAKDAKSQTTTTFQIGQTAITTDNTRDTAVSGEESLQLSGGARSGPEGECGVQRGGHPEELHLRPRRTSGGAGD
jgi:hypothetical protein